MMKWGIRNSRDKIAIELLPKNTNGDSHEQILAHIFTLKS